MFFDTSIYIGRCKVDGNRCLMFSLEEPYRINIVFRQSLHCTKKMDINPIHIASFGSRQTKCYICTRHRTHLFCFLKLISRDVNLRWRSHQPMENVIFFYKQFQHQIFRVSFPRRGSCDGNLFASEVHWRF